MKLLRPRIRVSKRPATGEGAYMLRLRLTGPRGVPGMRPRPRLPLSLPFVLVLVLPFVFMFPLVFILPLVFMFPLAFVFPFVLVFVLVFVLPLPFVLPRTSRQPALHASKAWRQALWLAFAQIDEAVEPRHLERRPTRTSLPSCWCALRFGS